MVASISDKLASERRARLAAERMLDLRSRELFNANKQLSNHALQLSGQIVEQRQATEALKGHHAEARAQLQEAEQKVVIAERRLWDSVETITDGFAVFDSSNRLIAANSAWHGLFCPGTACPAGTPIYNILLAAARHGHILLDCPRPDDWAHAVAGRWAHVPVAEQLLSLADGRYFRLIDRRSRDGDMVCLAQDITAIKRREEELNEARKVAEAAARAKSAFLANMSHELRTPMNGVVSMAELMLEMDLDDEQELYLRTIHSSGSALLHIINDVLDFSKLEAERMVLRPEPFDLERLIHDVLLLLAPTARDKNLSLLVDYDLFLPARLIGDPGRLRQIMTNLVGNAVKFTDSGHVLVRAIGVERENDTWQLHITVEDTGIGVPEDMRDHIFGSFSQVDANHSREFEGTGLGLSICQQLVTLMGGEIWVESDAGEGSCFGFRIDLPCDDHRRLISGAIEPGLAHAMLIGGAEVEREVLAGQLAQLGVTGHGFARGEEALDALAEMPVPQMIFVEHDLDDGPGAAVVHRIRDMGLRSAIVMMAPSKEFGTLSGVPINAVMARPVLRSDLFQTLASLDADRFLAGDPSGDDLIDAQPEVGAAADVQAPQPDPPQSDAPLRRLRILAADDNKTNRFVFSKMIKALDVDLDFAVDGAEAIEKFKSFQPDIVFMDISMPRIDGKQATAAIRDLETQGTRIPIIALTAHALAGDAEDILAHGLDHYLTKPLKKKELLDLITSNRPPGCCDPMAPDG